MHLMEAGNQIQEPQKSHRDLPRDRTVVTTQPVLLVKHLQHHLLISLPEKPTSEAQRLTSLPTPTAGGEPALSAFCTWFSGRPG